MRASSLALALGLALIPSSARAELRYFDDAALHAVQFVDAQEGWAVGDEGVVWHTIDGGKKWERQPTGTRASLRDLHFLNPYFGWVAGREELPNGGGSVGVILFTRDGGLKWHRLLQNAMPGLNKVRFVDDKIGFLFGDGSDQFPTGVFKTADGGKTWEPVPGPRSPAWLAGAFRNGPSGLLAGAWTRLATFRQDAFATGEVDPLGGRSIRGIAWLDKRALAVGQGGLILTSQTSGAKWGFANLGLPPALLQALDFHAIHGIGDRAWVVGRPGSVVLHTADQGGSWKVQKTGQPLPLNGVFFRDELVGWAVGEGGTIIGTTDGGLTWTTQQQAGKRAAVMCVHARASDLPAETVAVVGGQEGYRTVGVRVLAPEWGSAAPRLASDPQRWAAALRQAGGISGEMLWQFPMPQHLKDADGKELLRYWNMLHNPRGEPTAAGAERLLVGQLVLALRTWRPQVVITGGNEGAGDAAGLVAEALREACKQAADPTAFPEHIERLSLAPWTVAKLYTTEEKAQAAQVTIDGNEPRAQLEGAARDFAAPAAGLLHDRPTALPNQRFFRLLESTIAGATQQPRFMDGLAVGDEARRRLPDKELTADAKQAIRTRRHMENLAENIDDPNRTLAHVLPAVARLPEDQGAAAAFAIASQYARRGQWLLAREAFLFMVDRYPAHPLSADAYRWLIRHSSSSEARRRQELGQFMLVSKTSFVNHGEILPASHNQKEPGIFVVPAKGADKKDPKQTERPQPRGTETINDGQGVYLSDRDEIRHWYRGSLEFGKRFAGFGPLYASDPSVQFCLQSSRRQLGDFTVKDWYTKFKTHFPRGPWHDAAAAELWLMQGGPAPPKGLALCRLTDKKPFLDGELDDACWQGHQPLVLSDAVAETAEKYPTEAWFAYDQDFLYIALRCKHPAGQRVAPVKVRPRDADLHAFDRVSILIDLDRDYSTYYRLEIDQRGCVYDDCWGDVTWNPKWFVAVKSTEDCWQIEAAMPLAELTGDRINQSTVWACNVVRVLPGRGVQGWSLPADVEPRPEGMGLMLFRAVNGQGP
jgi:photosystem II stability/assembly factor-like uncharacterized protein